MVPDLVLLPCGKCGDDPVDGPGGVIGKNPHHQGRIVSGGGPGLFFPVAIPKNT